MLDQKIESLLVQPTPSAESRAITKAAYLTDTRRLLVAFEALADHADSIRAGNAVPIGSVEYVREAMRVSGIQEPYNLSYPSSLQEFLYRNVRQSRAGDILGEVFVKPVKAKAFTGFVFHTMKHPDDYAAHDRVQYEVFMSLAADEQVWRSEPVHFASEWRYYVMDGVVLGCSRYDPDGPDDNPSPDPEIVASAVRIFCGSGAAPTCFAIDMGVLDSGETALVEVNDAWALGFYPGGPVGISEIAYMQMLQRRWNQMAGAGRPKTQHVPPADELRATKQGYRCK